MKREVGGGIGMGNTCKPMAVSFQCMTKYTTIKKKIKKKKEKGKKSTKSCDPDGASGKQSTCQGRRLNRYGFHPWVGKIPWGRAQQPTPVFLPGESQGQKSLAGYSL